MLDFDNLQKMIDEKYISVQKHPMLDLFIYNYTNKTQYEQLWNNETMQCRGLIMDSQKKLVSRPFPKFMNLDQHTGLIPTESFEVFDKLDGSLGITYPINGRTAIATRGSFESDQAIRATGLLVTKYLNAYFNPKYTYLFEIIFPENRIVVDYGDTEDLFLLTILETETGKELPFEEVQLVAQTEGFPIVERFDGITDISQINQMYRDNKEGFVIRFQSGLRLKIKYDEYKRLHRLLTGITARRIWELLSNNQPLDDLLDRVPDEFYQYVTDTRDELNKKYMQAHQTALNDYAYIIHRLEKQVGLGDGLPAAYIREHMRKDFALLATKAGYPKILFAMLDEREDAIKDIIWKMLRPAHEIPFRKEEA